MKREQSKKRKLRIVSSELPSSPSFEKVTNISKPSSNQKRSQDLKPVNFGSSPYGNEHPWTSDSEVTGWISWKEL